MILRFSPQSDSPHSQIFRKAGQKKAEPNMPIVQEKVVYRIRTTQMVDISDMSISEYLDYVLQPCMFKF
jgi:hypothetical protein